MINKTVSNLTMHTHIWNFAFYITNGRCCLCLNAILFYVYSYAAAAFLVFNSSLIYTSVCFVEVLNFIGCWATETFFAYLRLIAVHIAMGFTPKRASFFPKFYSEHWSCNSTVNMMYIPT
jgi:hypothetical protein